MLFWLPADIGWQQYRVLEIRGGSPCLQWLDANRTSNTQSSVGVGASNLLEGLVMWSQEERGDFLWD